MTKTIIAGTRTIDDLSLLKRVIAESCLHITEVVCGTANGVDALGALWASQQNPKIPVKRFPPNWDKYGKAAGPLRNQEMVEYADNAIVIWDNQSKGTADLIRRLRKAGKKMFLHVITEPEDFADLFAEPERAKRKPVDV